jgi:hypothetical protein
MHVLYVYLTVKQEQVRDNKRKPPVFPRVIYWCTNLLSFQMHIEIGDEFIRYLP